RPGRGLWAGVRAAVVPARGGVRVGPRPYPYPPRRPTPVVVFDAPLELLLFGEPDAEVEVEVAAERGRPGKRPPHPPLVRLQLRERRPRRRPEHYVVVGQMLGEPVEAVRDRRAGRAAGGVVGPEHEMVDEELRTPLEEVRQRGAPLVGLESIFLVDANPRQFLPPPRKFVAAPRQLLLRLDQFEPRCEPLFTCSGLVLRHRSCLLVIGQPIFGRFFFCSSAK